MPKRLDENETIAKNETSFTYSTLEAEASGCSVTIRSIVIVKFARVIDTQANFIISKYIVSSYNRSRFFHP